MAVSFKTRLCDQCAGKLQYIKEKKLWQCMYCGAEIERQESYDGLFTIKNVVRQTLLDCAYRRLDSAQMNLSECEKIDSRYVGTLIARITYQMICAITPGALSEQEMRGIFSLLSKSYSQLKDTGEGITDEEEAFYDFLEEADAFATLLLVYDSLGDTVRRDFVFQHLDAGEVFSLEANNNLLSYGLKNEKTELCDKVIKNNSNLDVRKAFGEVLSKYPDNEKKSENIKKLLSSGLLKKEDRRCVEEYIASSGDSFDTKVRIVEASLERGLRISLSAIVERLLPDADSQKTAKVLSGFCKSKMTDEEELTLLGYAYSCKSMEKARAVLDCLRESGQFVMIPARMVITMLSNDSLSTEEKLELFERAFDFKLDQKGIEAILTNYLCYDKSPSDVRLIIIDRLLSVCDHIPTATVENYVVRCSTDGEKKPSIVGMIFDKGLNVSFFGDLISKYMNSEEDPAEIGVQVIDVLTGHGLKMDPASMTRYVCEPEIDPMEKITFINRMLGSGSQLRSDCANAYLESVTPEAFSPELFSQIFTPASTFSKKAIENYVIRFREREAVKAQNVKRVLESSPGAAEDVRCLVQHLGNTVSCNLLQAYALTTTDQPVIALEVCRSISSGTSIKLSEEMAVSGSYVKFKKYATANKGLLSEATAAICEKYKVYSLFF
ncbi:MAG: hypothetical protein E7647_01600 [Ruminococcaceae bacterium]|nr:hypothetical protein [Oscillospiraceae bacterium]